MTTVCISSRARVLVRCHPGSQIEQSRVLPASPPSRSEHHCSSAVAKSRTFVVSCPRRLTLTISSMLWNASPLASRKRQRCPVHQKCNSQCWTPGCCHVRSEEEAGCLPRSRPCHLGCLDDTLAGTRVVQSPSKQPSCFSVVWKFQERLRRCGEDQHCPARASWWGHHLHAI